MVIVFFLGLILTAWGCFRVLRWQIADWEPPTTRADQFRKYAPLTVLSLALSTLALVGIALFKNRRIPFLEYDIPRGVYPSDSFLLDTWYNMNLTSQSVLVILCSMGLFSVFVAIRR
jgi:hypothetical protein